MAELSTAEALLRLLLAAGLGGAIGLRARAARPRGGLPDAPARLAWRLRIHARLGLRLDRVDVLDPERRRLRPDEDRGADRDRDRFLGAGAIIVRGISVRGLTTAATLWVVAAIGMAAGTGYYEVGISAAALVLVSLHPAQVRQQDADLACAARGGGARDRARAGRRGVARALRIEELGGQVGSVVFGDERTVDVVLRASTRAESARVAGAREAGRRRARPVEALRSPARIGQRAQARGAARGAARLRLSLLETDRDYPPEDGETAGENAWKALFAQALAPAGAWALGETPGSRRRRSGVRGSPRPAGRRTAASRAARRSSRARTIAGRATCARSSPSARPARRSPCAASWRSRRARVARHGGLRLRPDLRPGGEERTVAELGDAWSSHSHRARAAAALLAALSAADTTGSTPAPACPPRPGQRSPPRRGARTTN